MEREGEQKNTIADEVPYEQRAHENQKPKIKEIERKSLSIRKECSQCKNELQRMYVKPCLKLSYINIEIF